MPTTIVLVRHGETDWNRENRFQGHADIALNDAGRRQARDLAELLRDEPVTAVYTSPLRRASETADIVANRLGFEAQPLEALREIDVGAWEGLTIHEVRKRHPESEDVRWHSGWEDGETRDELTARVVPALLELGSLHAGGHVLAVTHAGPIRATLAFSLGLSHEDAHARVGPLGNCSVFRFAVREGTIEKVD